MEVVLPMTTIQNRKIAHMYGGVEDLQKTLATQRAFEKGRCETCLALLVKRRKYPTHDRIPEKTRERNKSQLQKYNTRLSEHRRSTTGGRCNDLDPFPIQPGTIFSRMITPPQSRASQPSRPEAKVPPTHNMLQ